MSKPSHFKVAFLAVSAGLFVGTFVYGLFDLDFSNREELMKLVAKSLTTGVVTGLVMGIFNMYLRIGNFQGKKD